MFDCFPFPDRPGATPALRRVLSVCGGGLLGVIPAAMLNRYEDLGKAAYGAGYRLSDSFDLVGGTSTGAVIATGVALGLPASEIADFYLSDVPKGFRRRRSAIPLINDMFDGDLMQSFFARTAEGRVLEAQGLACHLMITAKDLSRGRPLAFTTMAQPTWPVLGAEIRQDKLPLDLLLRASTAAPGLFSPVALQLEGVGEIIAADGGMSPFNDRALLLSQMARGAGASAVDVTALGTGSTKPSYSRQRLTGGLAVIRALRALMGTIKDGEMLTDTTLQMLAGHPESGLSYRRHDMGLDAETFELLGLSVSKRTLAQMRRIADFAGKERLFEAATVYAERTITTALPLTASAMAARAFDSRAADGANGLTSEGRVNHG